MDTSYQPDVELASNLWIHEGLGHGVGLHHRPGGIMNPSILRRPITWRGDPSEGDMRKLYGGVPLTPVGPEPPTPPDKPKYIFEFEAEFAGQKFALTTGFKPNSGWII